MGFFKGRGQRQGARKQEKRAQGTEQHAEGPEPVERAPRRFSRWSQEQRDRMTAHARAQRMHRWAIMSGDPNGPINYQDPQIEIEYQLSDIDNLRLVYKGRHRDEFLAKLSPDAQKMYFEKDPDGKTYQETVEDPSFFKGFLSAIGVLVRGDQKQIEQLLKELDEQNRDAEGTE